LWRFLRFDQLKYPSLVVFEELQDASGREDIVVWLPRCWWQLIDKHEDNND
jgi:hypothetical protein